MPVWMAKEITLLSSNFDREVGVMQRLTRNLALTTAAVYAIFGALWILFSDRLLAALVVDPLRMTTWQTYKGSS